MGDFDADSDFHESLRRILDDVDLSIDQRLEQLVALLGRLEPALLEVAAEWEDGEIAKAFLEFVKPTDTHQERPRGKIYRRPGRRGGVEKARRPSRLGRDAIRAPGQGQA